MHLAIGRDLESATVILRPITLRRHLVGECIIEIARRKRSDRVIARLIRGGGVGGFPVRIEKLHLGTCNGADVFPLCRLTHDPSPNAAFGSFER